MDGVWVTVGADTGGWTSEFFLGSGLSGRSKLDLSRNIRRHVGDSGGQHRRLDK